MIDLALGILVGLFGVVHSFAATHVADVVEDDIPRGVILFSYVPALVLCLASARLLIHATG